MKDIAGFEGRYAVTEDGRVWSHPKRWREWRYLAQLKDKGWYKRISFVKEKRIYCFQIHRLVALAFLPISPWKRCVNHINGIRDDNRVENLEWVTHSENSLHWFKINGRVQLTRSVAKYKDWIKIAEYKSLTEASNENKVQQCSIRRCIFDETWMARTRWWFDWKYTSKLMKHI